MNVNTAKKNYSEESGYGLAVIHVGDGGTTLVSVCTVYPAKSQSGFVVSAIHLWANLLSNASCISYYVISNVISLPSHSLPYSYIHP